MEIKRVACKACGVKLEIKNLTGEAVKLIRCPKCKATLQVVFHQPVVQTPVAQASPNETCYPQQRLVAGRPVASEETVLPRQKAKSEPLPSLVCEDKEYRLKIGQNIVGRHVENDMATVPVMTSDRTMSRAHAIINVVRLANGSNKTVISNCKNKNNITVNGVELQRDEQLVLTNGSVVEMGLTSMIFVQKTRLDEN